jgi:hypothetical protein
MSPLAYEAYNHVPSAFLITADDKIASPALQRQTVIDRKIDLVQELATSHSPFLSKPEETALFLRTAAGETV